LTTNVDSNSDWIRLSNAIGCADQIYKCGQLLDQNGFEGVVGGAYGYVWVWDLAAYWSSTALLFDKKLYLATVACSKSNNPLGDDYTMYNYAALSVRCIMNN
jgi:hypothetical protein